MSPVDWKRIFRLDFSRHHLKQSLDDELTHHLEGRIEEFRASGMSPDEARLEANRRFGDLEGIQAECHDIDSVHLKQRQRREYVRSVIGDIRFTLRNLRRSPAFSLVAVLTLALGIGGTTAIFSIFNGVILRPLPYHEPDRLVVVWESSPQIGYPRLPFSEPDFIDYREQSRTLAQVAGIGFNSYDVLGIGDPQRVQGTQTTPELFGMLGAEPELGRLFIAEDGLPGAEPVALLEYGWWQDELDADPAVVGTSIDLNGRSHTVIGVMPEAFQFPPPITFLGQMLNFEPRIWTAYVIDPEEGVRDQYGMFVIARMADDVTIDQVNVELGSIAARLAAEYPEEKEGVTALVEPVHRHSVEQIRLALWILLGAVAFVLLIACVNVANLLLARAGTRRREIAIRMSVGAGRGRLVRQLLIESMVLAAIGGVLGMVIAVVGAETLTRLNPIDLPAMFQPQLDIRVLVFTVGVTLLTGILFGLTPALQTARSDLNALIREGGRSTEGPGRQRTRQLLVIFETAITLVLLTATGLMIRSFSQLRVTDPGFNPENVLSIGLNLPAQSYPDGPQQLAFYTSIAERFRAVAGVEEVAVATARPFSFDITGNGYRVDGEPPPEPGTGRIAFNRSVSAEYLETFQIPLHAGRFFDETDAPGSEPVVVVNEAFIRQHPGFDGMVGRRITGSDFNAEDPNWLRVVGVVADVHSMTLEEPDDPAVYFPFTQAAGGYAYLLVRTNGDPETLQPTLQQLIWEVDSTLVIDGVGPVTADIRTSLQESRFSTVLFTIFGIMALLLAAIGLYGVVSYSVSQMSREIGIRIAFGAHPTVVLTGILKQGLILAGVGIGFGVAGALATTRFLQSFLIGVSATDLSAFAAAIAVLFAATMLATLIPARRAVRIGYSPASELQL
ncbi:ADOP family duplicated permease [Gemmatimonadota bacterium]